MSSSRKGNPFIENEFESRYTVKSDRNIAYPISFNPSKTHQMISQCQNRNNFLDKHFGRDCGISARNNSEFSLSRFKPKQNNESEVGQTQDKAQGTKNNQGKKVNKELINSERREQSITYSLSNSISKEGNNSNIDGRPTTDLGPLTTERNLLTEEGDGEQSVSEPNPPPMNRAPKETPAF